MLRRPWLRPFEGDFEITTQYPLLNARQRALQTQIHIVGRYHFPLYFPGMLASLADSKIAEQLQTTVAVASSIALERKCDEILRND
jgi:hypothetical protein